MTNLKKFKEKELSQHVQTTIHGGSGFSGVNLRNYNAGIAKGKSLAEYFVNELTAQTTEADCISKSNYARQEFNEIGNRLPNGGREGWRDGYYGVISIGARVTNGTQSCLAI